MIVAMMSFCISVFVGKVTKKLPNHQIFAHIFFRTMPSRVTIHNKRNSPHGTFAMRAAFSSSPSEPGGLAHLILTMFSE